MNEHNFFKRWIKGIKELSPAQQLHAKMAGYIGSIIGILLAMFVMFTKGMWYWGLFLFFIMWLQVIEYIGTRQKYEAIVKMMDEIIRRNKDGL